MSILCIFAEITRFSNPAYIYKNLDNPGNAIDILFSHAERFPQLQIEGLQESFKSELVKEIGGNDNFRTKWSGVQRRLDFIEEPLNALSSTAHGLQSRANQPRYSDSKELLEKSRDNVVLLKKYVFRDFVLNAEMPAVKDISLIIKDESSRKKITRNGSVLGGIAKLWNLMKTALTLGNWRTDTHERVAENTALIFRSVTQYNAAPTPTPTPSA